MRVVGLGVGFTALVGFLSGCGGIAVYDDGSGGEGGTSAIVGSSARSGNSVVSAVTQASSASLASVTSSVAGGTQGLTEEQSLDVGQSTQVRVEVDDRTLGVTLVAQSPSDFATLAWTRETAPSGSVVYEGMIPSNEFSWESNQTSTIAIPQIGHPESFPLARGTWTFDLDASTTTNHVSVWTRRTADGAFHGGVIDVNFFVPAQIVAEDYLLDVATDAYGDWAGIQLGNVSFFTIDDQFIVIDDFNVFDAIDTTKSQPTRPALNIVVTSELQGSLEAAAGFALGVPGTAMDPGSLQSAIVWMITDPFFDPIILRHEAGHFAGLFHTSEFEAPGQDPLDDTPSCPFIEMDPFGCPDAAFVMFPSGPVDGTGGIFSAKETTVIHGSSLYRGVFSPGEAPAPSLPLASSQAAPFRVADADAKARAAARVAARTRLPADPDALGIDTTTYARLLDLGCDDTTRATDDVAATATIDVATLMRIAETGGVPALARRRALLAILGVGSAGPDVIARVEAIARDSSAPRIVRTGAFRALADLSPSRHADVRAAFAGSTDLALRASARR